MHTQDETPKRAAKNYQLENSKTELKFYQTHSTGDRGWSSSTPKRSRSLKKEPKLPIKNLEGWYPTVKSHALGINVKLNKSALTMPQTKP